MQFACPFCAGLFEVEPSSMGQHVACPLCTGVVLVPAPSVPHEISAAPPTVAPIVVPTVSPTEIDFDAEPARVTPHARRQRASQRMIHNIFWMGMGLIVLTIMAVILVWSQ